MRVAYALCAIVLATVPVLPRAWGASTEQALYSFNPSLGTVSGLTAGRHGEFYGTQSGTGLTAGAVFELTPPGPGQTQFTKTVLHQFDVNGPDGAIPLTKLLMGRDGTLYGTTSRGGAGYQAFGPGPTDFVQGDGTVFKLSPPAAGQTKWSETILHSFFANAGPPDDSGSVPASGVIADAPGRFMARLTGEGCSATARSTS